MTLQEFQAFAADNREWLDGGNPETEESLAAAEDSLGCRLPPTLRWLLKEYGYSDSCGVDSLAGTLEGTLRCRDSIGLLRRDIILNDWNDAGVVFFDTARKAPNGEFPITWTAAHNLNRLAAGDAADGDADVFEDYPLWVRDRLDTFKDEAVPNNK